VVIYVGINELDLLLILDFSISTSFLDIYSLPLPLESLWSPLITLSTVTLFSERLVRAVAEQVGRYCSDSRTDTRCGEDKSIVGVGDSFSRDVIELLKARYEMDWRLYVQLVRSQSAATDSDSKTAGDNRNTVKSDVNSVLNGIHTLITTNHELSDKITALVHDRYAPMFVEGFITTSSSSSSTSSSSGGNRDDPILSNVLKGWKDEYLVRSDEEFYANKMTRNGLHFEKDRVCEALENRIAILQIKLCDYLEDVFLYVSNKEVHEEVRDEGIKDGKKSLTEVRVLSLFLCNCVLFVHHFTVASRGVVFVPVSGLLGAGAEQSILNADENVQLNSL
jgi:hypothetical protein